jgi:acyl carrier protein
MTDQELIDLFSRTLQDLLGDDTIALTTTTTRAEVPGWDSFNYINFIAVVETELKIRFRISDVESFENVGGIVRCASTLLAAKK